MEMQCNIVYVMYCNPVHCTGVDIVMMYYAIIVSNVNNVSIVDK